MSYEAFFHLDDAPFRLPPDPDYYFPSRRHREGLETLLYSINAGEGFVQITGEPGVGKTLLVRNLLNRLGDDTLTALILHPRLSPEELFRVILIDLGVDVASMAGMGKEPLLRAFRDVLLEKGEQGVRTVVIIDEAQELPRDSLEELRLLSNLETSKSKLLQIILVGQLELENRLQQPDLTQLHQRITIRYRLAPFSLEETREYIRHRLKIAGRSDSDCFPDRTVEKVYRLSKGIPRKINILCERSLMAAYVDGTPAVSENHVVKAFQSIEPDSVGSERRSVGRPVLIVLALLFVLALAATGLWSVRRTAQTARPASTPAEETGQAGNSKRTAVEEEVRPGTEAEATGKQEKQAAGTTVPATQAEQVVRVKEGPAKIEGTLAVADIPPVRDRGRIQEREELARSVEQAAGKQASGPEQPTGIVARLPATIYLPPKWTCITLDRNTAIALVWQGRSQQPVHRFPVRDMIPAAGIYILARDRENRPFLFNHNAFFSWDSGDELAAVLFRELEGQEGLPEAVPLLVTGSAPAGQETSLSGRITAIKEMLLAWAESWRDLNIDRHIQFYDRSLVTYRAFRDMPTIIDRQDFYRKKQELFARTAVLTLQISDPLCIVDPGQPDSAVVLFRQRYTSPTYVDEGIKILYLRRTRGQEHDRAAWLIRGRLWIPTAQKKKG